jgi:hypothetical protein
MPEAAPTTTLIGSVVGTGLLSPSPRSPISLSSPGPPNTRSGRNPTAGQDHGRFFRTPERATIGLACSVGRCRCRFVEPTPAAEQRTT